MFAGRKMLRSCPVATSFPGSSRFPIESLSNSVFERRTSTGSGLFASLGSGLVQTLGQIVFIRAKKLSNTNLLESRHIKEKKASLPVDVRRSKTSLLKLPNMAAAGEKILAHSRNHVTDLSAESGNLFKMATKIKSERIWVRGLETGEKQTKWRQR